MTEVEGWAVINTATGKIVHVGLNEDSAERMIATCKAYEDIGSVSKKFGKTQDMKIAPVTIKVEE